MTTYLFSTSTASYPNVTSILSLDIKFFQPEINFSQYDYLIITSKQISQALKFYKNEDFFDKKALCVSEKSAQAYSSIGGQILDIASGYGDTLSQKIHQYPLDTKWLYLRGENIASSFADTSRIKGYEIEEKILYRSSCKDGIDKININDKDTLIFTSPSSVECFLKVFKIKESHKVIVIGKTTAKALPTNVNYEIAKGRTIEDCLVLV